MKHFVILELYNEDAPMIGIILNVVNTEQGIKEFKIKLLDALGQHFDVEDFNHDEIPDLFVGSPYEDLGIETDGMNYDIRIIETWIY